MTISLQQIEALGIDRERELETTKQLLGAARALAETTSLSRVLEALADIVLASTAHRRVTVLMWDEARRQLQAVVVRGDAADYPTDDILTWDELSTDAKDVVESGRSKVIDYDAQPEDRRGRAAAFGARLGLVVPIAFRQRLVGLVRVDDPGERRAFVDREIALIQGIAAQAAVAIENSRLYEEEHGVADALRSIFQQPVPVIDGLDLGVLGHYASETASVGGDFYDAFALGGQVAVLVGDVAGKGLAAVGLTERTRSAVRALAYAGGTAMPGYLLGKVNDSLNRELETGQFVTAALLTIDPRSGAYRIASAGHPVPVVCGSSCRQLDVSPGTPLGVMEDTYCEVSGVLKPHETLVMYTDGVTEARRDSEFYGEERLMALLAGQKLGRPTETAQALYADVHEFARGKLADDLLIVALRLEDASGMSGNPAGPEAARS